MFKKNVIGILDSILGKRSPPTLSELLEKKKKVEEKKFEAKRKLDHIMKQENADPLNVDRYARELMVWEGQLMKVNDELKKLGMR